jgi:AcrR family transcriptional regulator
MGKLYKDVMKEQGVETRRRLLEVAIDLAEFSNMWLITRDDIAKKAGCAPSLVTHYFGNIDRLRGEIWEYAIAEKNHLIIVQGASGGNLNIEDASAELLQESFKKVSECLIRQLQR